jgi:hypothetical protein
MTKPIVRRTFAVVQALFVVSVLAWHHGLPRLLESYEKGDRLGLITVPADDMGITTDELTNRRVLPIRWITGRGIYLAVVDPDTRTLVRMTFVDRLHGWHEIGAYLLWLAAMVLLVWRVTATSQDMWCAMRSR